MKITDLKVYQMATGDVMHGHSNWNWTFVKIETDEGIHGIGEGSLQYKDEGLRAELEAFKRFLIGQNPLRIEYLWTALYRRVTWTGGAVTMSAISAIDLALWDIKGKVAGLPVYELVGGKFHKSIKLYANGWTRTGETPEEYAEGAKQVVAAGYQALKMYPFNGPQIATPKRINLGVERVQAVREAVGPDVEVAVDVRAQLNIWSARRVAQQLQPLNIAWMEEPIPWDNAATMIEFAKSVEVPIATGEQLFSRWDFRELLESNTVGIIQPDICHAGGMTELKKLAAMAETYYVTLAPHNSNGPISTVASLHLQTCIQNSLMQELFISVLDLYNEVLTQPLVVENGQCYLQDVPGWGTDLEWEKIKEYPPHEYTPIDSEPYTPF